MKQSPMNKDSLVEKRLPEIKKLLSPCVLCPRECKALRLEGKTGFCKTTDQIKIASWACHRGEEPPISGTSGSGTIFSSNCTLGCIFCQNFPFSQLGNGQIMSSEKLALKFDYLCKQGVHNLNFVTPTHVIPLLLEAWLLAEDKTKQLPLVYNTSGYDSLPLLKLLDGIIDVYLPDIKYSNDLTAMDLSKAPNFVESNRAAILEMFRQAGELQLDKKGIAKKGIIIRHLVLPENLSGTRESFEWIRNQLGTTVHISLMSQYFPAHNAFSHKSISRPITEEEYSEVIQTVEDLGFTNVWAQDPTIPGGA